MLLFAIDPVGDFSNEKGGQKIMRYDSQPFEYENTLNLT